MIAAPASRCPAPQLWANSGGPASRTRKEHIRATLLGRHEGRVRCPNVRRLGLYFDLTDDPVEVMTGFLHRHGFDDPEALRREFAIPQTPLIAAALPVTTWRVNPARDDARTVLEQALMLGLCTQHVYDPARPVLWTTASLTRVLELFDPTGFYA